MDGEVMTTRGYCNEQYYGKKLAVSAILSSSTVSNDDGVTHQPFGAAVMRRRNRDYETLIQMLNDYCVDEHLDNNNYIPPDMVEAQKENEEEEENGHLQSEEEVEDEEQLGGRQIHNGLHTKYRLHDGHALNGANGHCENARGDIEAVEIGFADEELEEDVGDPEVEMDHDIDSRGGDGQIVDVAMGKVD